MALRQPTRSSQPCGEAGAPLRAQCVSADSTASCSASSASWKSPGARDQGRQQAAPVGAQRVHEGRAGRGVVHRKTTTGRSSTVP